MTWTELPVLVSSMAFSMNICSTAAFMHCSHYASLALGRKSAMMLLIITSLLVDPSGYLDMADV